MHWFKGGSVWVQWWFSDGSVVYGQMAGVSTQGLVVDHMWCSFVFGAGDYSGLVCVEVV